MSFPLIYHILSVPESYQCYLPITIIHRHYSIAKLVLIQGNTISLTILKQKPNLQYISKTQT